MAEPQLSVFPGGGRVTILDPGGPGTPTLFEVEWRDPSLKRSQETQAFWKLVNGHVDPFWFSFAGTRYEPCHFEAHSFKTEQMGRGQRLVVRFFGTKAAGKNG
jgi:hypothetical protein